MATSSIVAPRSRQKAARTPTETAITAAPHDRIDAQREARDVAASPSEERAENAVERFLAAVYTVQADRLPCFYAGGDPAVDASLGEDELRRKLAAATAAEPARTAELRMLLRRALRRDGKPTTEQRGLPNPAAAYHSESQRLTILRSDWSAEAAELAIDWSQPELRIELMLGKQRVLQGNSLPNVRVDGVRLEPRGVWEEVCWESNVDADYLELEIALSGGARLQRQFVLTRRDGLLYTADAVLLAKPGEIECELRLPLAAGTTAKAAMETRETTLAAGKRKLLLVPPSLPEWRCEKRGGELTVDETGVCLRQTTPQVRAAYLPLCLVYDARRARRECTWRRLTVGEDMQLASPDRACGFRIQLGKEHWLAYRSMTERTNRTVLGVNLQTNFLLSRFTSAGDSEPLVEIDDF